MAPLSNLTTSTLALSATSPSPTHIQPSNLPTLYVPDTKARNAVIFGTIATVLTIIGIVIAGATLRIAYQTRRVDNDPGSNSAETGGTDMDMEMASINDSHALSQTSTVDSNVGRSGP